MRHYTSWLDAFTEAHASLQAPQPFKYWTAMAVLAAACERRVWWTDGNAYFYPNLYTFLVAERSTGKSTILKKGLELLHELPGFTLAPTQLNEATLIETLVETGRKRSFSYYGKTYPNSSICMFGSEGAKLFSDMGSKGNNIVNTVTDLYNCGDGPWSVKAAASKATRMHGLEEIFNPCINILAGTTSNWLMTKMLNQGDIEGGFGSRIMFCVWPDDSVPFQRTTIRDQSMLEAVDKLREDLGVIHKLAGAFTADSSWIDAYDSYREQHIETQRVLKFSDPILHGCFARKANSHLVKLSMLLAIDESLCVGPEDLRLEARHAHKAWKLLSELEKTMPHAFEDFAISESVKHTHVLLKFLKSQALDETCLDHLRTVFKNSMNSKELKDAVNELKHHGHLVPDRGLPHGYYKVVFDVTSRRRSPKTPSPKP